MPEPLDPLVKAERELERLRIDNSRLRSLNKKLLRRGGGYDDFVDEFRKIIRDEKQFTFSPSKIQKHPKVLDPNHTEIIAAPSSDLHLSETIRREETNGINFYNSLVAANRLWEHVQKIKYIVRLHQSMYNVKRLWSPLLGDCINGTIHPEMITTNDMSDAAAVVLGGRLYGMFYKELSTLGLPIDIDTSVGNHPRTTVKVPSKRIAHSNLDWVIYEYLADHFAKSDQIDITVHTGQIAMRSIYAHRYLFEHGMDVRSGHEEEYEDRVRAMFDDPAYRSSTGLRGPAFDQIVIGNMHKPKFLERTIVNGCYSGNGELGTAWRLKPIKPIQLMWGISSKYVRTFDYMIDLSHVRTDKVTNPFSEYAKWYLKRHGR